MSRRRKQRNKYPKKYCTINFYECTGLTHQGKGIVEYHNKIFYVDELLEGEFARFIVYFENDHFGQARAIMLKNKSPKRALELGHWKFSIGTYHLPHLKNQYQDEFKQQRVNKLFSNAKPIIVGKRTFYRNKVSLTNGGFMAPGKRRRLVLQPEKFDLMEIDFKKYKDSKGVTIIRKLDTEIVGKPGTKIQTTDSMFGYKFVIGLDSFYQVNSEMARIAYKDILDFVNENSVVADLFGGSAIIGILASKKAKQVYSVEINTDSHNDAKTNIKINKIKNVDLILGDANLWIKNNLKLINTIIVDPARAGLSELSCKMINNSNVKKIIYLSCNIDSQYRDIQLLTKYKIIFVQPYDFFPQTYHIENLVVLEKI